jgi:hypothetical protein
LGNEKTVYAKTSACFSAFVDDKMSGNDCLLKKNWPAICFGRKTKIIHVSERIPSLPKPIVKSIGIRTLKMNLRVLFTL